MPDVTPVPPALHRPCAMFLPTCDVPVEDGELPGGRRHALEYELRQCQQMMQMQHKVILAELGVHREMLKSLTLQKERLSESNESESLDLIAAKNHEDFRQGNSTIDKATEGNDKLPLSNSTADKACEGKDKKQFSESMETV
eukprot:gnl/TRDRNA2_/TRDRNA2_138488_c0_seq2.p1 gnl/TRDRNA2_/TRDRNA2_138488_c0~~gnl/TRDRNA2_/TRDRNA2_138488_c0_seq2.p1  ORF type:complete len:142 (-),score=25.54 gnl/TRDRNA2_/TRDRNA2_138488_c0_seq2:11-436(-)